MIDVTGFKEDIRSVNEKNIKYLKKLVDITVIVFLDNNEIEVTESIKTLDARINALNTEKLKEGENGTKR